MHVTALEVLWLRLLDVGEQIPESQVISKILSTLPSSYRHFYTTWNNSPNEGKTVKLLLSKLQEEEAISELDSSTHGNPVHDGAFASNEFSRPQSYYHSPHYHHHQHNRPAPYFVPTGGAHGSRGSYQGGRGGFPNGRGARGLVRGFRGNFRGTRGGPTRQNIVCSYCQLGPHKVQNCRHRINDGAPLPPFANANVSQVQQIPNKQDQEPDNGHHLDFMYTSSIDTVDFETFGFVADSGASQHMTDKRSILINFKPFAKGAHSVIGIGNTRLQVEGKGDVEVVNAAGVNVLLIDCLLVPGLGMNLFSISAATEKGVEAIFFEDKVQFFRNGNLEMEGQRASEKLYYLDVMVKIQQEISSAAISRSQSISIWHQRLGHTNHRTILNMVNKKAVLGLNLDGNKSTPKLCNDCIKGKMHVTTFPTGRIRGKNLGALIHSDVTGPMETMSPGRSYYFVLFKDDFSNWCEVYFMQKKSQVPEFFRKFVASLKTQHNATVSTLRSDNGGEYTSREFEEWLAEQGIRHETSAPYSPQQVNQKQNPSASSKSNLSYIYSYRMACLNEQIVQ